MVLAERMEESIGVKDGGVAGSKRACSSLEGLRHGAGIVAGPGALMRDLVAPEEGRRLHCSKVVKSAAQKDSARNVSRVRRAFLIAGPHLAGTGDAVIVAHNSSKRGWKWI